MWRCLRVVTVLSACTLLTYCGSPESLAPGLGESNSTDGDVEAGALKAGQLQTRNVDVPSGYVLADMNGSGDLLLGNAWLPKKGPNRPIALPFTGTFINDQQQIFGTDLSYYQNGQVVPFGDPCSPITSGTIVWDCSGPVSTLARRTEWRRGGDLSTGCYRHHLLSLSLLESVARQHRTVAGAVVHFQRGRLLFRRNQQWRMGRRDP